MTARLANAVESETLVRLRPKKRAPRQPLPGSERSNVRHIDTAYPRGIERPKTRGDCLEGGSNAMRPCGFVSCKYHLYLDVHPVRGSLKLNYPDREPHELAQSCALDIADLRGVTLEEVGEAYGVVRERIRQIEADALLHLRAKLAEPAESDDD